MVIFIVYRRCHVIGGRDCSFDSMSPALKEQSYAKDPIRNILGYSLPTSKS
jgi:hypothetical protein